jgi:hypothetical protein
MKKYEKEIRDLLEKIEKESFIPETPKSDRPSDSRSRTSPPPPPRPIRPKQSNTARVGKWMNDHGVYRSGMYMMIGYFLVIGALVINTEFIRGAGSLYWLVQAMAALGGILFIAPVVTRFFTGRSMDTQPKMWRGEFINDEPAFTWQKVKQWFSGNRNNRGGGYGGSGRWR